jgi:hypothetical protein
MLRHRVLAIATACACCAVPAIVLAAPKPPTTTVTISVSQGAVTFGKAVTISGTTTANTAVTLRGDAFPFNNSFAQVAKTTSNAAGAYSFTVTPDTSTHYRADAKKAKSPVAALAVRWKVTRKVSTKHPKRGSRVQFSGLVSPAHNGGTASIQRRSGGVWKTVKTTTLAASTATSSAYAVRIRVRRNGTYRVRVEGDGAHDAGNSSTVKLTVH